MHASEADLEMPSLRQRQGASLDDEAKQSCYSEGNSPSHQQLRQQACNREDLVKKARQTISAASKLLRRKIPQSGHLMTSRRFWMQTVPSQDVDAVITFPANTSEATVLWFKAKLEKVPGLLIQTKCLTLSQGRKTRPNCYAFHINATYQGYLRGLELMQIPKQLKEECGGGIKEFTLREATSFKHIEEIHRFLNSCQRQEIILHLLNSVRADKGDTVQKIKFREGEAIVPRSLSADVLFQVFPVHEPDKLQALQKKWVKKVLHRQPIGDICDYFGIKIAFYFSWLGHYTTALSIPAAVGLCVWFFLCGNSEFLEDLGFVVFSFFNVIWATLYLESWKRRSAELSYQWGTADQKAEMLTEPRALFKGEERLSEVTGKPELYYPDWKRHTFRYCVTAPVIFCCLVIVAISVFLILELQQWWDDVIASQGYFDFLRFLPKILLAVVIPVLDSIYSNVALWLNDMENYRSAARYENNLIVKMALFQFVNSFLALFYTAFYLQDMDKLKELLAALLITRQVVGNIKESLLPYAKKHFKMAKLSFDLYGAVSPTSDEQKVLLHKKTDGDEPEDSSESSEVREAPSSPSERRVSQAEVESSAAPYEGTFEDYLEMFIQFGYVTLFSSAYPLAGLWALLNNLIEIRGDAFKLCLVHQRPFGQRVSNIGSWQTAMEMMGVIAVIVNCALIGQSGQVHRMFPDITPVQTMILVVGLEHLMFLLKGLIAYAIPDIPSWVATEMAKIEFRRREIEKGNENFMSFTTTSNSPSMPGSFEDNNFEERGSQTEQKRAPLDEADISEISSSSEEKCSSTLLTAPSESSDRRGSCSIDDTEAFKAAVSNSNMDIFQKAPNPKETINLRKEGQSRFSPLRTNSLKLPDSTSSSEHDLRKRSCPDTIHEDELADHKALAASITQHDENQARLSHQLHYGNLDAVDAASQLGQLQIGASSSHPTSAPPLSRASDQSKRELFERQMAAQQAQIKLARKMLSKRMSSDSDLWLSLKLHQERYSRLAAKATESSSGGASTATASASASAASGPKVTIEDVSGSKIIVNRVDMPSASSSPPTKPKEGTPGAPTPINKRALDQEEFNKKLKAKRALFSKSRSLSLASFSMLSKPLVKPLKPLKPLLPLPSKKSQPEEREDEEELYLELNQPKGELDLLNLEALINVDDVSKQQPSTRLQAQSARQSHQIRGSRSPGAKLPRHFLLPGQRKSSSPAMINSSPQPAQPKSAVNRMKQ